MADEIRARDVDDIWVEVGKIAADARRKRNRQSILRPARDRDRGDIDEIAGRGERRMLDGRRIDPQVDALPEQIIRQAIERLVGAVAHIIIVARKEGYAKVARLHRAV